MGKKRSNPVSDVQIIEAYRESQSAYKVAALLGIGDTTVYRVLRLHQVVANGLGEYRRLATLFSSDEGAQIRVWYEAGATLDEIKVRLGRGSQYSIRQAILRSGGTLRDNPAVPVRQGEVEKVRNLHNEGLGQFAISLQIGRSQGFVSRIMRRHGIPGHTPRRETHPMWKGGRARAGEYVRVLLETTDPMIAMANSNGYVLEHRVVKARSLGRPLLSNETVHHIDGNKSNNDPSNLQLRRGKHGKGAVMRCADCGSHNIVAVPFQEDLCLS